MWSFKRAIRTIVGSNSCPMRMVEVYISSSELNTCGPLSLSKLSLERTIHTIVGSSSCPMRMVDAYISSSELNSCGLSSLSKLSP